MCQIVKHLCNDVMHKGWIEILLCYKHNSLNTCADTSLLLRLLKSHLGPHFFLPYLCVSSFNRSVKNFLLVKSREQLIYSDSNPGSPNGRSRSIHWSMATLSMFAFVTTLSVTKQTTEIYVNLVTLQSRWDWDVLKTSPGTVPTSVTRRLHKTQPNFIQKLTKK